MGTRGNKDKLRRIRRSVRIPQGYKNYINELAYRIFLEAENMNHKATRRDFTTQNTMSIRDNQDWQTVEIKAKLAEAGQIHCEKVPLPTTAQQLAFLTTRCAELQARVHRLQGGANEALLWMTSGESEHAKAALSRVIIDL